MGLQIETDFLKLLESQGMSTALFLPLYEGGGKVIATMYTLQAIDKYNEVLAKVSSKDVSVIKKLPAMAAELSVKLDKALANLWVMPTEPVSKIKKKTKVAPKSALELLPNEFLKDVFIDTPGALAGNTTSGEKSPYPVLDPAKKQDPIYLRDASGLYRRVKGSNASSVYFLLGDSGDLKLAGRWLSNQLSVRFESYNMGDLSKLLAEVGMKVSSPHHASLHVEIAQDIQATKLVFALIGAANMKLISPLPYVPLIKDQV